MQYPIFRRADHANHANEIWITWPDGTISRKGNNGAYACGIMGGSVNHREFQTNWTAAAQELSSRVAAARQAFSPLLSAIYDKDYKNRHLENPRLVLLPAAGVVIEMPPRQAQARAAVGEVIII